MKRTLLTILFFLVLWAAFKVGRHLYFKLNVNAGETAPNIMAELKDGTVFNLQDLKGKMILLHFWGSWCPPCRKENPEIRKLYEQFHNQKFRNANGFEILSIGIEADEFRWHNAILKDRLDWNNHISEINMFDGKIATSYGVRQIPALILLGPDLRVLESSWTLNEIRAHLTAESVN